MAPSGRPDTASGQKKLTQGTLFSFFSKKSPANGAPSSAATKPQAKATKHTSTNAAAPTKPDSKPAAAKELWQQVTIGSKLEVYWPDDEAYYQATVTGQRNSGKPVFTLSYQDGELERVDLSTEQFRFVTDKSAKKKRTIQEDSEQEFELEDSASEEGGDESAYEHDEAAHESDDDEDESQWMVTDDDEEATPKPTKQKKKLGFKVTQVNSAFKPTAKKPKTSLTTPRRPPSVSQQPSTSKPTVTPMERRSTPTHAHAQGTPIPYEKDTLNPAGSHVHNHLKFLQNPKDSQGRTKSDANYDAHTLRVNYNELATHQKVSQANRQWWEIKSQYFDTVLLFKTGKFYELYHMDADVGVQVLDFNYMKGHVAHAGFPEVSYGIMAERLVKAGYKVARVEQTETPEMLKERKKKKNRPGPTPQVVNREVCSVLTRGTRTFCYLDDASALSTMESGSSSVGPLLSIREVLLPPANTDSSGDDDSVQPVCEYGVTVVDAVRATVTIGQFADDVLRSRMNTLLAAFEPSEVLVQGGENGASPVLQSLLRSVQASSQQSMSVERIQSTENFPKSSALDSNARRKIERKSPTVSPWDVNETLDELHRKGYYPRGSRGQQQDQASISRWPKVLQAAVEGNAKLALSSFGAVLFYLQRNLIDQDILGMGTVKAYIPPSSSGTAKASSIAELTSVVTQQEREEDGVNLTAQSENSSSQGTAAAPPVEFESDETVLQEREINHMALDGTTLQNLEVLFNSQTNSASGSLWSKINFAKTPHGCRLLRAWLLRPLFRKEDIERRGDAVEELVSGAAAVAMEETRKEALSQCGDIERLLTRVHSMSGVNSSEDDAPGFHPNERAVLYEGATHTKRKVEDFSKVLNYLQTVSLIPEKFAPIEIQSPLLLKLVRLISDGGCFPDVTEELDWFFENFDVKEAASGRFEPSRGVDEAYDEACDAIERIERELADYKDEMCNHELKPSHVARSKWKYINTKVDSKDKYLIELPASLGVPEDFHVKGKRGKDAKQVNKYRTPVVEQLVQQLEHALDVQRDGKSRGMQLIFAKFDEKRHLWAAAAQATALLDALGSLAQASSRPGFTRPKILECPPDSMPSIRVVQGRHPCVDTTHSGGDFIPNDLVLGEAAEKVLLLSGPNMGGKSTLLRQTCLLAILAQIGCFVPASECALTPVDRIYTRLGASDRILQGHSTFFVELSETACALRGATRRSLVIMDELGRGTSTFDGTAIASAAVKHLVERNRCLTLFATHYHSVLEEWQHEPTVRLGHMECIVEGSDPTAANDGDEEMEDEGDHNITFLYTLGAGACPKSFGINVARLAGLPEPILSNAKKASESFEAELSGIENNVSVSQRIVDAVENGKFDEAERIWESLQRDA